MDKGKFTFGFFLTFPAWLLSLVVIGVIMFLGNSGIQKSELWMLMSWHVGISAIIWIPLALIAGNMAVKKGNRSAGAFIVASFFIATFIYGGCTGMLR